MSKLRKVLNAIRAISNVVVTVLVLAILAISLFNFVEIPLEMSNQLLLLVILINVLNNKTND